MLLIPKRLNYIKYFKFISLLSVYLECFLHKITDSDIYERLRALSMVKINNNILTKFSSVSLKEQRLANVELNKYIRESLGNREDWKDTLINDFKVIANEEVFQNPKSMCHLATNQRTMLKSFDLKS